MPAIQSHSNILVTGASGFIAAWIVQSLIDRGHSVVGTVRSSSKGEYLKRLFGDKFSYVIVEDIEQENAFDEAIKMNIDAVAHVASPVLLDAEDPALVIGPAVQGTTGILASIKKHGSNVKRVVLTSSTCSMLEPKESYPYTFTEADWNDYSADLVAKEGKKAPGVHKYRASKVLAERAAWDFVKHNKNSIGWDLVTIHPPEVFGPTIHEVKNLASLNATSALFHAIVTNSIQEDVDEITDNFVDVRDVGLAHALALEVEEAGNERFSTSVGPYTWKGFTRELRAAGFDDIPESTIEEVEPSVIVDGSKATRVLGLQYRSVRETVVDGVLSLRERFPGSC